MDQKISQKIVIPCGMEYPEEITPSLVVGRASLAKAPGAEVIGKRTETAQKNSASPGRLSRTTNDQRPTTRSSKHRVLGEEAARPKDWSDLENVIVDVEITDWPTATQGPRGRVVEILGYEDDFGVDVDSIIRKHHLPHTFPVE